MSLQEIRSIREKQAIEAASLKGDVLRAYFDKGANELQKVIDEKKLKINMKNKLSVGVSG